MRRYMIRVQGPRSRFFGCDEAATSGNTRSKECVARAKAAASRGIAPVLKRERTALPAVTSSYWAWPVISMAEAAAISVATRITFNILKMLQGKERKRQHLVRSGNQSTRTRYAPSDVAAKFTHWIWQHHVQRGRRAAADNSRVLGGDGCGSNTWKHSSREEGQTQLPSSSR